MDGQASDAAGPSSSASLPSPPTGSSASGPGQPIDAFGDKPGIDGAFLDKVVERISPPGDVELGGPPVEPSRALLGPGPMKLRNLQQ